MTTRLRPGIVCALVVALVAIKPLPGAADPPPASAAATTSVQDVPAIVEFKDRDVYRGGIRLVYGAIPHPPTEDATVSFDDHRSRRRGFVAVPQGAGTFTTRDGTTFTSEHFVDGRAYGPGSLTVPGIVGTSGMHFVGVFVAGEPYFGDVNYANGATYHGYLADGCYAAAPAAPPPAPAGQSIADLYGTLPPTPMADRYTAADGMAVSGVWQHHVGGSCLDDGVSDARVQYPSGDVYLGDLAGGGHYTGFGAAYLHGATGDILVCGTRPATRVYGAGAYALTAGRFRPAGNDARAVCSARYADVTTVTAIVRRDEDQLDGRATARFANGDRADGWIRDGVFEGPGTYRPSAYAATISGVFHDGRLSDPATITDACGTSYPAVVRDGIVRNAPGAKTSYLFRGCDSAPDGFGTAHLDGGETITALWRDGRPNGHAIVRVRQPFVAVIDIPHVRSDGDRFGGEATIRFANGDVARGVIDASLDASSLEGPGTYAYAASGCTAHGVFVHGKLHGRATLVCPHEGTYTGVAAADGSVQ